MKISEEQLKEWTQKVIATFGEETVKKIDTLYLEYNSLRAGVKDNLEFMKVVYGRQAEITPEHLVAIYLYGISCGEIGAKMAIEREAGKDQPAMTPEENKSLYYENMYG